ncbi:MAG: DUF1329 domain-containing protein [Deltaproteobacteria bacterium]|nr:DUF1329 domain-containing protein [Deltaproteobacteria bacterium]
MRKGFLAASVVISALAASHVGIAGVTPEEAAKLKTTLTPVGAERAGNKDGTIPAWDGGYTKPIPGATGKKIDPDPFTEDKPLLRITAKNAAQYQDKLNEGSLALLKQYPETFRIDVYPTRRTYALQQWIYDNTFKNAANAKLTANGLSVEAAYGGIPFPIPKNGAEVMWNHTLHPRYEALDFGFKSWVGTSDGKRSLASRTENHQTVPYYYKNEQKNWDGRYLMTRLETIDPPFKAGELLVISDSVDPKNSRQAWQYLVGQRRVRRAPTVGWDTPDFVASGANYFDEVVGFYGPLDRYEWKLIGKREMYIPYNNNGFFNAKTDDAYAAHHLNPDKVRWELHRVWVVEGTLAPGKRHVVPKRRFYLDEDNWTVTLVDGYDAAGKLWRTSQVLSFIAPSIPLMNTDFTMVFNLQARTYAAIQSFNEEKFLFVNHRPLSHWSGDSLGSEGVR